MVLFIDEISIMTIIIMIKYQIRHNTEGIFSLVIMLQYNLIYVGSYIYNTDMSYFV